MNGILRDFLNKFVTVYPSDVCVYSRTPREHMEHLRLALQRLKEEGLNLRLKKCFLGLQEMEDLGYTVSIGKISVSTNKLRPLQTSQRLRSRRKFAVSCNSATSTPDLFIVPATLRLH
jgi:hypothetical protein